MSCVSDIVLLCALGDSGHTNLSEYLKEHHNRTLERVDEGAGGDKVFQANTYMCAINYLCEQDFIESFHNAPWEFPENVQLLIKGEWDSTFKIYKPNEVYKPRDLVGSIDMDLEEATDHIMNCVDDTSLVESERRLLRKTAKQTLSDVYFDLYKNRSKESGLC